MKPIFLPRVKILLTKRPDDMTYEEFRARLRAQKRFLRGYWEEPDTDTKGIRQYRMGRLDGIVIPPSLYKNSKDPLVVLEK